MGWTRTSQQLDSIVLKPSLVRSSARDRMLPSSPRVSARLRRATWRPLSSFSTSRNSEGAPACPEVKAHPIFQASELSNMASPTDSGEPILQAAVCRSGCQVWWWTGLRTRRVRKIFWDGDVSMRVWQISHCQLFCDMSRLTGSWLPLAWGMVASHPEPCDGCPLPPSHLCHLRHSAPMRECQARYDLIIPSYR